MGAHHGRSDDGRADPLIAPTPTSQSAASRVRWDGVRDVIGQETFTFGPSFAQQALHAPRHLLFVFSRYKVAARLLPVGQKVDVLELGRGEGVGTPLLAEQGHRVLGVPGEPGVGTVVQGLLESSNADPRAEYLRVIQAQRAYELNVRALRTMDEMLQDAANLRRT